MKKKIVIALGGNALGFTPSEQKTAAEKSAQIITDLIEEGHEILITHGNGPQIGMIHNSMDECKEFGDNPDEPFPLPSSVSMSQGYIGHDLQSAIYKELAYRAINKSVVTIITQVAVDADDPAFSHPTKPIGRFMSKKEAELAKSKGLDVIEDSGRGYRTVIASPLPKEVIEINTIKCLLDAGQVVIAGGGGGIPVVKHGDQLHGVNAVIDKDFTSSLIAKEIDADLLLILTAVEKVAINFGKDNVEWLSNINLSEALNYIDEGYFAPGSMLPKVRAAMNFVSSGENKSALITHLEKAKDGIKGDNGTLITS